MKYQDKIIKTHDSCVPIFLLVGFQTKYYRPLFKVCSSYKQHSATADLRLLSPAIALGYSDVEV
ncbi:MAG: hypothetical protein ACTTI4_08090, partial [Prevotella fusca]|uniref:hypothetical protein n=1 Tax=Prevotella fusca TaxID=589436 RepID=UPI003F9EE436